MFSKVTGAEKAKQQQPVWHQFLRWTPLMRNRCTKPVARAVVFVLIAFVRAFIACPGLDYESRTVLIEKSDIATWGQTHTSFRLARHLRFNRGEVSLEVWLSHASLSSFSSSWKYRLVSPAKTNVIWLLEGEKEDVHMPSYLSFNRSGAGDCGTRTVTAHLMSACMLEFIRRLNFIREMRRCEFCN